MAVLPIEDVAIADGKDGIVARLGRQGVARPRGAEEVVAGARDQGVVGAADADPVVANAPEQLVLVADEEQLIVAVVAEGDAEVAGGGHEVVARSGHDVVAAGAAVDGIVAAETVHVIGREGADQIVVTLCAENDRVVQQHGLDRGRAVGERQEFDVLQQVGAVGRARPQIDHLGNAAGQRVDAVVGPVAGEGRGIGAGAAVEVVVSSGPDEGVVAAQPVERVVADAAHENVVAVGPVLRRRVEHGILAQVEVLDALVQGERGVSAS